MSRHFFYERKEAKLPKEPNGTPYFETYIDSFNLDCVIRSYQVDADTLFVLLNDGHEESRVVDGPVNSKQEPRRERQWIASQIILQGQDIVNFRRALGHIPVPSEIPSPQLSLFPEESNATN